MQRGQRYEYDVLIIGSGLAGLSFALNLAAAKPNVRIALLAKKQLPESNSYYAQGGIAAVTRDENALQKHFADTLAAGDGLCYPPAVEGIINSGPQAIEFLLKQGVKFDKDNLGAFHLVREGGHSERRIYHHGDTTGQETITALAERIQRTPQVKLLTSHIAINLITQTTYHSPGTPAEVIGSYVLDENSGLIDTLLAKVVVLATGGAGKVYRYTTNPEVATGDGIAMAYRAGARVGNMEFYQFHPTLLYHPEKNNFLISEALRGEGAYLRLPETGERFMQRYAPDKMELATRDIVARAIFNEMEQTGFPCVHLDVRHLSASLLQKRFPSISYTLKQLGIDPAKNLIPVVPAAHYLCGGVLADIYGKTDLPRLYAIGETAFTGLHGANRLASNSLLEAVVMGQLASSACLAWLDKPLEFVKEISNWDSQSVTDLRRASQINAHWRGLRGEMTSYAGIIRTDAGLKDLLKLINTRAKMIEEYYWQHTITRDFIELRNIVLIAELIARSALSRQESRGGHYRADYPEKLQLSEESVLRFPQL
jgi:L-aspartate oxidase